MTEPTTRALIGRSEMIEAEFSCSPLWGQPFCFAEMVDDEVIAVSGFDTLDAATRAAKDYGFTAKEIEYFV
jgi:hypothetical protein